MAWGSRLHADGNATLVSHRGPFRQAFEYNNLGYVAELEGRGQCPVPGETSARLRQRRPRSEHP